MQSKKYAWLIQVGLGILGVGLMGWMASRTLHFVELTVPVDQKFMGYLFLLATGGGSLIWGAVYLGLAKGYKQRGIAFALGVLDLIGEAGLAYADSKYVSSTNGIGVSMTPDDMSMFVLLSVGMVFINIFGVYFFHLYDPTSEQEQHAQDMVDDMTDAALKNLNNPEVKAAMIERHRPQLEAAFMASVAAQVGASIGKMQQGAVIDVVFSPSDKPSSPAPVASPAPAPAPFPVPVNRNQFDTPLPQIVNQNDLPSEVGGTSAPFQPD